jgi:hypothetical protein
MWHFEPDNSDTAAVTVESFFNGFSNGLRKNQQGGKVVLRQIKKIIDLWFWYNQHVSFPEGKGIKERTKKIIFFKDIPGYFARNYF